MAYNGCNRGRLAAHISLFNRTHLLALPSVCAGRHLSSVSHHVLLLGLYVTVRYTAYLTRGNEKGKGRILREMEATR